MSAQSLGTVRAAKRRRRSIEQPMVHATFGIAARRWYLAPVSTAVAELTGRAPRSVREVLEAHRAELTRETPGIPPR